MFFFRYFSFDVIFFDQSPFDVFFVDIFLSMYYFSTNRFRCLFFRLNDFDVFFFDILKSTKTQSIILLFDQNFFEHLHFDVLPLDVFIFDIFHFDFCLSIINFRSIDFDLYFSMYFFSMFQGALIKYIDTYFLTGENFYGIFTNLIL